MLRHASICFEPPGDALLMLETTAAAAVEAVQWRLWDVLKPA